MKYLLSLSLYLFFSTTGAIAQVIEYSSDKGNYEFERTEESAHRIEQVIWEEDFSDGIPATWTNTNYDLGSNLTEAKWEYRGPSTTPSNEFGTIGNCIDEGAEGGDPILSLSAENGFVIFDSDYWDSNEGECTDFGTGPSPAPHNAALTTESLNLSDSPYIAIQFTQYVKNFDSVSKLQVSVGGGEFEDIYVNEFTGINATSERDMTVRKNISNLVANQSDVRFRFSFSGSYYFWIIDDLQIISIEQNNVVIDEPLHNILDIESASSVPDFIGIQYFKYPLASIEPLIVSAKAVNLGADTQSSVTLTTTLSQDGAELDSSVSTPVGVPSDGTITLSGGTMVLPAELGKFDVNYAVEQLQMDESPENNQVMKTIEVTQSTLARDEGPTDSFYFPDEKFANDPYEVGAVYVPSDEGNELYSISAGVSANTPTGTHCYASLYGISVTDGALLVPIATTELQVVQFFHLNDFGDEQMMVFDFDTPIPLEQDSSYLALVGTIDPASEVTFAMSGEAQPLTAWAKFNNQSGVPIIQYLDRIPLVRMNFDQVVSVTAEESEEIFAKVYPNPASDFITIEYNLSANTELIVSLFDIQGKLIENLYAGKDSAGNHKLNVDVSSLKSGTYLVRVHSELGKLEETLVIK